jgi:hypothetical protein
LLKKMKREEEQLEGARKCEELQPFLEGELLRQIQELQEEDFKVQIW